MVAQGCSIDELCTHLDSIRVETIGVGPDPNRDREIAKEILLIVWKRLTTCNGDISSIDGPG